MAERTSGLALEPMRPPLQVEDGQLPGKMARKGKLAILATFPKRERNQSLVTPSVLNFLEDGQLSLPGHLPSCGQVHRGIITTGDMPATVSVKKMASLANAIAM
jgi:hypothetical protein